MKKIPGAPGTQDSTLGMEITATYARMRAAVGHALANLKLGDPLTAADEYEKAADAADRLGELTLAFARDLSQRWQAIARTRRNKAVELREEVTPPPSNSAE